MVILESNSRQAVIDDEDFDLIRHWKWSIDACNGKLYVRRAETIDGKLVKVYLHRFLMQAAKGVSVDHIDGGGLNNRRSNLRLCSHRQNIAHRTKVFGRSRFLGVCRKRRFWESRIFVSGVKHHLGCYLKEEDAAEAYDAAARFLNGEFAGLNFPGKNIQPADPASIRAAALAKRPKRGMV